jgi:cell division protein FtsI (penicillin-binding protein 3)
MQQLIAEETSHYQADWGGIIVMEAKTGKIRAIAETPTVDPNDPGASAQKIAGRAASRLVRARLHVQARHRRHRHRAGRSHADVRRRDARPHQFPNGAVINDSENHPTENLTLTGGLVESSNVAMSQFGTTVSPEVRQQYLSFGVGGGDALNWSGDRTPVSSRMPPTGTTRPTTRRPSARPSR